MSEHRLFTRALATARANATLALLPIAYGVAALVLSRMGNAGGLLTPEGSIDVDYGAVCVAALVLGMAVVVVLPGVVAYRVVCAAASRSFGRAIYTRVRTHSATTGPRD